MEVLDIFIGKSPVRTRPPDEPIPVQRTIREVLRPARNRQPDRRKNTTDRRRARSEDYLVTLSGRRDRRSRSDRRQNRDSQPPSATFWRNRRKNRFDRRRSVNSGVHVTLSTRRERRSRFDRRGNRPL